MITASHFTLFIYSISSTFIKLRHSSVFHQIAGTLLIQDFLVPLSIAIRVFTGGLNFSVH